MYNLAASVYNTATSLPALAGFGIHTCEFRIHAYHPSDNMPLTNQKIKVFSPGYFFNSEIGTYETDRYGNFSFTYNSIKLPFQSATQDLVFRVYEETMASKFTFAKEERLVFESTQSFSLREGVVRQIPVELYEYEKDFPRFKMPENTALRPQQWNAVDYYRVIKSAVPGFVTFGFAKLSEYLLGDISVEEVKNISNIQKPNFKLSPESTLNIVLNGICPNLREVGKNAYLSEIKWHDYEFTDPKDLPDGALYAFKDENNKLQIEKIVLKYRGEEATTHYPRDADFEKILFDYNRLALAKGSLAHHLGTHMEVEQYTVAIKRHIQKNPIAQFIGSSTRGNLEINQAALTVIIQVLYQSGLTEKGTWANLTEGVAGRCWSNFQLDIPFNDDHRLAHASHLAFTRFMNATRRFINEHIAGIKEHWYEIKNLSDVLVKNSLPYQPFDDRPEKDWDVARVKIDGVIKSVRPITSFENCPEDHDEEGLKQFDRDIENLKQLLAYFHYQATWGHWIEHISEDIGLDPTFARFAPDRVKGKDLTDAIAAQIRIGNTLTNFVDGSMLDNPNGDVHPYILEEFSDEFTKQQFAALGYDITKLFYGTII